MTTPLDALAPRPLTEPHLFRLPLTHPNRELILYEHARAVERKMSGYIDPNSGLFATTALYLAQRGVCCNQGCRHCPYLL